MFIGNVYRIVMGKWVRINLRKNINDFTNIIRRKKY